MMKFISLVLVIAIGHSVVADDVIFYYYSGPGATAVQLQSSNIATVTFDITKQTKIMCHGALANSSVAWYSPMKNAFLSKGYQVIAIDWGKWAQSILLSFAKFDAVGNLTGQLIVNLYNTRDVPLANVHIIGHSMGAHIAGYAARYVKSTLAASIGRVTALDGNSRSLTPGKQVLGATDAEFVDGIHTNVTEKFETASFFPNGANAQPGCSPSSLDCNHNRATHYFIESITSNNFIAKKCDSYSSYQAGSCNGNESVIMGDGSSKTASGDYYLNTNSESPYAQGGS